MEKQEWKKNEKHIYLPKSEPTYIEVPRFSYFVIEGEGSPDAPDFAARVEALYTASYGVRMSHKSSKVPEGYYEYTVYPLEGLWDLNEEGRKLYAALEQPNVNELKAYMRYKIMIRQPEFATEAYVAELLPALASKKKNPLVESIRLHQIEDGPSIQMLHIGPFADEPASFSQMEAYAKANGFMRASKVHREIYLSDPRKTSSDKLKTTLRFAVTKL